MGECGGRRSFERTGACLVPGARRLVCGNALRQNARTRDREERCSIFYRRPDGGAGVHVKKVASGLCISRNPSPERLLRSPFGDAFSHGGGAHGSSTSTAARGRHQTGERFEQKE